MAKVDWSSPLGAGISLLRDCSHNIKSSSGISKVYEAIYGRLLDKLWYAPDYGFNLFGALRSTSPLNYETIASQVETELLKDDRILSVDVNINYDEPNKTVYVYINGVVSNGQTFNLIGNADLFNSSELSFNI